MCVKWEIVKTWSKARSQFKATITIHKYQIQKTKKQHQYQPLCIIEYQFWKEVRNDMSLAYHNIIPFR